MKSAGRRSLKPGRAAHRPPCWGQAPALHFNPSLSVVNSRVDRVRVWGGAFEVDWCAYSRTYVNTA